ncbi:MAG: hypothetical protein HQM13_07940 [SAR324 cluster bacterium]|nr:hypothetical protein [SAR324 cluster bacterium]
MRINSESIFRKITFFASLLFVVSGCSYFSSPQDEYFNSIPILGVVNSRDKQNKYEGELISLQLKTNRGQGRVFVSLQTYHELDTQIAFKNAHDTACYSYDLPCDQYDFHYAFSSGKSNIIKGQSGSSALGFLLLKTLRQETIDPKIVMTGTLYPGGIVGLVGGIDEKIELAQTHGFKKIFIPQNAVCEKKAFCSNFRLNHQKCVISTDFLDETNQIRKTSETAIRCPRTISPTNYPIDFSDCSIRPENVPDTYSIFCTESLKHSSFSLQYQNCRIVCKKEPGQCSIRCDNPAVKDFIKIKKIISLDEILNHEKMPELPAVNDQQYQKSMKQLSQALCERKERYEASLLPKLPDKEDSDSLHNNQFFARYKQYQAENIKIKNSSFRSFYSLGNTCFQQSVYLQTALFFQKYADHPFPDHSFSRLIRQKSQEISNRLLRLELGNYFEKNIRTKSDLQIFLIVNDRRHEIMQLIETLNKLSVNSSRKNLYKISETYAGILEKTHSLELWEGLLRHRGKPHAVKKENMRSACRAINQAMHIKTSAKKWFHLSGLRDRIHLQKKFSNPDANPFVCFYKGMELEAEMNAALNFVKLRPFEKKNYIKKFLEITLSRIKKFSEKDEFLLLPYMYYEHAKQLFEMDELEDSFRFAQKAISFSVMDIYFSRMSSTRN